MTVSRRSVAGEPVIELSAMLGQDSRQARDEANVGQDVNIRGGPLVSFESTEVYTSSDVIDLDRSRLLRRSRTYAIYDHPTIEGVLLKVRHDWPDKRQILSRYSQWRYGALRSWHREATEYLAALNRGCPEISRLARFMGFSRTTEGPAIMVEKLTGPNGDLAPTVLEELSSLRGNPQRRQSLNLEVMELLDDLERGRIMVGDLSLANIVRAKERNNQLVVVDGIGERVLFPLAQLSRYAFKRSIARRRARLEIPSA